MGYVFRECGKVTVHADTCAIIVDERKADQLQQEGKLVKRRAIGLVIYLDSDFDAFYNKHCARIANDNNSFTIVVLDDNKVPSRQLVRLWMEWALQHGTLKNRAIIYPIEKTYILKPRACVRTYFQNSFSDEPKYGYFRFLDVKTLSPNDILALANKGGLSKLESQNLQSIWKAAFTSDCEYAITYIWIIGHTDVI